MEMTIIGFKQTTMKVVNHFFLMMTFFSFAGCSTYQQYHMDERAFHDRSIVHEHEGIITEAAALSTSESEQVFGAPLNRLDIQPVWLKITNNTEHGHWFFPISVDNNYYPAYEAAARASNAGLIERHEIYQKLVKNQLPQFIPSHKTVSGFVYTHSDEGMKAFNVELHSPHKTVTHTFVTPVPGLPVDYFDITTDDIYSDEMLQNLSLEELRDWVTAVFCCTKNHEDKIGDPVNLVFIGQLEEIRSALISRHWDVTAPVTGVSLMHMIKAFLFESRYRYAPISKLYLFERDHDLAFQKARDLIDERNHMRIWLAPITYQGKHVWFGQISRDVGVKLSGRLWPPTTHVIDPEVDDARFYLLQDLIEARAIHTLAYVHSHEPATPDKPHLNAENDPYFTDGMRAIIFMSEKPVTANNLKILNWEIPDKIRDFFN